jgi:hypothetical protein
MLRDYLQFIADRNAAAAIKAEEVQIPHAVVIASGRRVRIEYSKCGHNFYVLRSNHGVAGPFHVTDARFEIENSTK